MLLKHSVGEEVKEAMGLLVREGVTLPLLLARPEADETRLLLGAGLRLKLPSGELVEEKEMESV